MYLTQQNCMEKKTALSVFLLITAALAVALVYSFSNKRQATPQAKTGIQPGFAVVELFTSEGCSSCPPADEAVAKLLNQDMANVYILSFHVDYWNRLGWNDPFSKAQFSARQRAYAKTFSLESIYTPQVVVNGSVQFVGSDVKKLNASVENGLQKEAASDLKISTRRKDSTITVTYTFSKPHAGLLHVALVQPQAITDVKRGENGGKTLRHVNVVSVFQTVDVTGNGHLTLEIPSALSGMPLHVIAYTQSKENYSISGAAEQTL